jgi:hypothetical protein
VLAVPRKQVLGDIMAARRVGEEAAGARADRRGRDRVVLGRLDGVPVAATNPDIKAAAAWYGPPARPYPDSPNPVTGSTWPRNQSAVPRYLRGKGPEPDAADATKFGELLKQTNRYVEIVIYPDVGHGFFADYRPSYNATAAADAWKRCTGFFDKWLRRRSTIDRGPIIGAPPRELRGGALSERRALNAIREHPIYEGWGKERKDEIARRVTDAITDVTKLPKEAGVGRGGGSRSARLVRRGQAGERMKK